MIRCTGCGFENSDGSDYCEHCGNLLSQSIEYTQQGQAQLEYSIPPPPPPFIEYSALSPPPPALSNGHRRPFQTFVVPETTTSRPGSNVFRVIRAIFYFIVAVPIILFGFLGTIATVNNTPGPFGVGVLVTLGMLVGSIVVFVRMRRRVQRLRWPAFILWVLGATLGAFMVALFEFTLNIPTLLATFIFECIVFAYGLVLAWLALW